MNSPRAPLMEFSEAFEQLIAHAAPLTNRQSISTLSATGRVLARDVLAKLDVPPMDNSAMDGYAMRQADWVENKAMPVSQRVPAGTQPSPLATGTAARIFTGAPMPIGADCVVMQEDTSAPDATSVRVNIAPKVGAWVRKRAEDIREGSVVVAAGTKLSPQACGLIASVGVDQIEVFESLTVACFFTGDELVMPGQSLPPGAIYNSNRFVLRGLLETLGCQVVDLGIVPDSFEATRQALRKASSMADLIITSGGMSVGEEDHIKPALQAEGSLRMWQMAIKPGKPLAYGTVRKASENVASQGDMRYITSSDVSTHFIGLPGNPVSAFVTFLLLVRPFIARLQGRTDWQVPSRQMRADFNWLKPDKRREFLRAKRNEHGGLDLYPNQGSGVMTSTVWADGLIDNPANNAIENGEMVRYIAFADLLS